MNNRSIQILLSNIVSGGSINSLINFGLTYKEIAELTDFSIDQGYVYITPTSVVLSDLGRVRLQELRSEFKNVPKDEWIKTEDKSRIDKITKDFIFLPKLDELP